jgi:hypothetical protein
MGERRAEKPDELAPLKEWCETLALAVEAAEDLAETMRGLDRQGPPRGGDPAGRLAVLMGLFRRLGVGQGPSRLENRALLFKARVTGRTNDCDRRLADLLVKLDGAVVGALDAGAQLAAGPLVRCADFGGTVAVYTFTSGGELTSRGKWINKVRETLVAGSYRALPRDHPLRQELREGDVWQYSDPSSGVPLMLLGRPRYSAAGSPHAEAWYPAAEAVALTRAWRQLQLDEQRVLRAFKEEEEYRRRQRHAEDPVVKGRKLEQQVAELQRELAEVKAGKAGPA